ncbi:hypothetical protein [Alkalilacustris brevis]|uniref:hypothetical protein n=1 Tax=Alkalilacustris brevis TaxID=2026338 RepID=UPI001EE43F3B|nr:hypothetical protein [Alkalilacustris brevis]
MNRMTILSTAALVLVGLMAVASPAAAQCFADYKAKRDNPLQLHYGVAEVSPAACGSVTQAAQELRPRLAAEGWELLNVVSVFDEGGLAERQENAGQYYLRF